jgi:hypothetical protein
VLRLGNRLKQSWRERPADRFKLALQEDTKLMPAYWLVATKKLNVRKA